MHYRFRFRFFLPPSSLLAFFPCSLAIASTPFLKISDENLARGNVKLFSTFFSLSLRSHSRWWSR